MCILFVCFDKREDTIRGEFTKLPKKFKFFKSPETKILGFSKANFFNNSALNHIPFKLAQDGGNLSFIVKGNVLMLPLIDIDFKIQSRDSYVITKGGALIFMACKKKENINFWFDNPTFVYEIDRMFELIKRISSWEYCPKEKKEIDVIVYEKKRIPQTIFNPPSLLKDYDGLWNNVRDVIRYILHVVFELHPFLTYFCELYCFEKNRDRIIYSIYNDYKHGLNLGTYSFLTERDYGGLNVLHPGKMQHLLQSNPAVTQKEVLFFEINVTEIPLEFVFNVKFDIVQVKKKNNAPGFNGFIYCHVKELIGLTTLKLEVVNGRGSLYYNCNGRVIKRIRGGKNFHHAQFNATGGQLAHILIKEPWENSYAKLNDSDVGIWSKIATLEGLIRNRPKGVLDVGLLQNFLTEYPLTDPGNPLLELTFQYLFLDPMSQRFNFKGNRTYRLYKNKSDVDWELRPYRILDLAIGLYKLPHYRLKRLILRCLSFTTKESKNFLNVKNFFTREQQRCEKNIYEYITMCLKTLSTS